MDMPSRDPEAPPLQDQVGFWNDWNRKARFDETKSERDEFMRAQRDVAVHWAALAGLRGARILDVGCGTGWLGASLADFGHVTGTDLSEDAIAEGRRRYPAVDFVCGDFINDVNLKGTFDFVVSADVMGHVSDQPAYVGRIAALLRPGGRFLLMTQNALVWRRVDYLAPQGRGQIRDWPPLGRIPSLLQGMFAIEHVSSIVPGGNRGLLFWVENRVVRGGMKRLVGEDTWSYLLRAALLGRELVVVARRRSSP
jgi:2-polyprenyl-3-methyl-5-hydroxy-6-metoxy-1,4-benzoquinol methylase